MELVTRFAPSPTGLLHRGHAFAAWTAWRMARQAGGRFVLRIEDIDPDRCRPEFEAAILEDLLWLGLRWDGAVRRQSERLAAYGAVLDQLAGRALVYPCFCSRAEVRREIARAGAAPHGPDGAPLYPGTCRRLTEADRRARIAAGEAFAWRLDMQAAVRAAGPLTRREHGLEVPCAPEAFGDVVLGRRDVPASYHLCVTHDDAVQGVTHVTRGSDLLPATDLHRLLQALLGWPVPDYAHHDLLCDAEGRRLSKRDGAPSLAALRQAGIAPDAILAGFETGDAAPHPGAKV